MSLFPEIRQLILKLLQVMCVLPLLHLEAAKRPNVLVILADDMGVGDVRSLNNESKIPTPNMDHLATEGLVFQDAHSASSIGALARYGMMTGRYCWRSDPTCRDVMGFDLPLIPAGRVTLGDLFKQKGYRTAYFGKWGLGLGWITRDGKPGKWDHGYNGTGESLNIDFEKPVTGGPKTLGFDYFFGIAASLDMPPYAYIENDITVGVPDKVTRAGGRQGLTVDG
ncbi:MAG: sulfatase-like hydrolase/transferase, partial [Opitutae bacterium]|nr:sulfatase-like hydrolase/transferase [Opitutae bacterium]